MNVRWKVEILEEVNVICFKSCFGKYLIVLNMLLYFGMIGKKVMQMLLCCLDLLIEWEFVREGV